MRFVILITTYCFFGLPQYFTALIFLIGTYRLFRPLKLLFPLSASICAPLLLGIANSYPVEEVIRSTSGLGIFVLIFTSTILFRPIISHSRVKQTHPKNVSKLLTTISTILFTAICLSYFFSRLPDPFSIIGNIISSNPSLTTFGVDSSVELSRFLSPITIFSAFVSLYTLLYLLDESRNVFALSAVLLFFLAEIVLSMSKGLFAVSGLTVFSYICYRLFQAIRTSSTKYSHVILAATGLTSIVIIISILPSIIDMFTLTIAEIGYIFDDSTALSSATTFSNRDVAFESMIGEMSLFGQGFGAPVSNVDTNSFAYTSEIQSLNFIRMMGIVPFCIFAITYFRLLCSLYDRRSVVFMASFFIAPLFIFSFSNPIAFSVQCLTFPLLPYAAHRLRLKNNLKSDN